MSLATSKWANDLKKGIVNEFKKCFEDYVERLEKEAKKVVEMLEKTTDAKAKADPANKKMMKEELKETKERVKIFKENTKKQMKDILNTLKLNPGNNQFKYKSVFQDEFENFQKNMELFVSGEGELPLIEDGQVKNILIKFSPSDPIIEDPFIEDPFMKEFYDDDESDIQGIQKMKRRFPDQNDPTTAVRTTHFMKLTNGQHVEDREKERAKRQKMVENAAEQEFLFGGGLQTKGLHTKGLQTKGLKTKSRSFRNQQKKTRRYK
jgi:putative sterol carrier protein